MIRSKSILPIRFYDDLFDQDRYNKFHNGELYSQIHYPVNALPNFQIFRERSLQEPTLMRLRNVCSDADAFYYKLIPNNILISYDALIAFFGNTLIGSATFDDGINPPVGTTVPIGTVDCGKLIQKTYGLEYSGLTGVDGYLEISTLAASRYDFKINIDRLYQSPGSNFAIKIYDGDSTGILLETITTQGIYNIKFKAANTKIRIYFSDFIVGDDAFEISNIETMIFPSDYALFTTDTPMDEGDLILKDTADGGIIAFCTSSQNNAVHPGEYYYIVECGNETYYSEVFSVKSLKEIENYYKLTWWNNCDLDGIIYDPSLLSGCQYKNTIWLDAALFKPEYNTTTENIQDGENTFVPVFKKWQKSLNLEIIKANEFLADSLSAMFIHDNAFILEPLNLKQIVQNNEHEILEINPDVVAILSDAFQKVSLKFLLAGFFTKSGCCDEVEEFECGDCTYSAHSDDEEADYYLVINEPQTEADGLFAHDGDVRVEVESTDLICDIENEKYYRMTLTDGIFVITFVCPVITSSSTSGSTAIVNCTVMPNTFAQLEYNINSGGWLPGNSVLSDSDGLATVTFNLTLAPGASDIKFRIKNLTANCEYYTSEEIDFL